jgi:hypothetical protein
MVADFLTRGREDFERLVPEAEAAGRRAYDTAMRIGGHLLTPGVGGGGPGFTIAGGGLAPARARPTLQRARRTPSPRPSPPRRSAPGGKLDALLQKLDHSDVAKSLGGSVAMAAGLVPGAARSVVHTVEGLGDAAMFAGRLMNLSGRAAREDAWDDLADGARSVGRYANSRFHHPGLIARDAEHGLHDFRVRIDPTATPRANTFMGELRRNYDIGMNQGETAADVASLFFGGAELKPLSRLGKYSKAAQEAKLIAQGVEPEMASKLAEPYTGVGHHHLPRRTKLPAFINGGKIPSFVSDSPFFRLRPNNLSKAEFYKLHYEVDPFFHGGRLPGGGGFSGKALGWRKLSRPARIWKGTPAPTKAVIVAPGMAGVVDGALHQEDWR